MAACALALAEVLRWPHLFWYWEKFGGFSYFGCLTLHTTCAGAVWRKKLVVVLKPQYHHIWHTSSHRSFLILHTNVSGYIQGGSLRKVCVRKDTQGEKAWNLTHAKSWQTCFWLRWLASHFKLWRYINQPVCVLSLAFSTERRVAEQLACSFANKSLILAYSIANLEGKCSVIKYSVFSAFDSMFTWFNRFPVFIKHN